jgi:hypothetical protein
MNKNLIIVLCFISFLIICYLWIAKPMVSSIAIQQDASVRAVSPEEIRLGIENWISTIGKLLSSVMIPIVTLILALKNRKKEE